MFLRRFLFLFLLSCLAARAQSAGGARELMLAERTQPGAAFVWQALRTLEAMPAEAMRGAAAEFERSRRLGAPLSDAERLLLIAWAEREPAAALRGCLGAMQQAAADPWEQERLGGFIPLLAELWCRLDARDSRTAAELLRGFPPTDAGVFLRRRIAWLWKPELRRMAASLQNLTAGVAHEESVQNIVDAILWAAVQAHGWKATARAVESLKPRPLLATARARMEQLREKPPAPPGKPQAAPAVKDRELRALFALNPDSAFAPLALRRAVCALSPAEAAAMRDRVAGAGMAADAPAVWMLAMRCAEDTDFPAAPDADTMLAGVRVQHTAATLMAARKVTGDAALVQSLRDLASPAARRDALSGYLLSEDGQRLIRGQLGSPVMAYAGEMQLPSTHWRAPLLAAAAAGQCAAAVANVRALPGEAPATLRQLRIELLSVFALQDPAAFLNDTSALGTPDELARAWAAAAPWLAVDQVLSAPPDLLAALPDAWWESLALDAPERGFALLEIPNRAGAEALASFAAGAVKKEPERAIALLQKAGIPVSDWPIDRLLHWHPEKVQTLAAGLTPAEWQTHARRLRRSFPVLAPALLRHAQPDAVQ